MSFELEQVTVLEIDLDKCNLNFGAGACTAGTDVHTGTSQAGATANTIKLAAGASGTDDIYNGDAITLADGRRAIITDYDGTSKVATVDRNWPINSLTRSEEIDHTDWSLQDATVSADAIRGPDGADTADKLEETAVDADHLARQQHSLGALALVAELEAKAAERTIFTMLCWDNGAATYRSAHFDLAAGTVTDGGTTLAGSATIKALPDGWFLCRVNYTQTTGGASSYVDVRMSDNATVTGLADTGDSYLGVLGSGMYFARARLREQTDPDEYIRSVASAIGLPDSVAYRIISAGGECYNAWLTCQDKANYEKGGKTWSFCTAGADVPPGQQIRHYIQPRGIRTAATEINLEKGLAPRAKVTVRLSDAPSSDIEADPYAATRAAAATGSFFARLMARNRNYAGRFARLKTGYFSAGWDESEFVSELYIIEKIDGPNSSGQVLVTLKDPIKLTDRAQVPAASTGVLSAAIETTSITLPLNTGDGAGYPASGHVRIGDEVIKYTTNVSDVLGGLTRGTFGTVTDPADIGDAVQLCKVYEALQPWQVLEDLLLSSGVPAANIDSAGFTSEDASWLGDGWEITTCLSEPEKASKYLAELTVQVGGFMWFDPATQKVLFRVLAPLHPEDVIEATLTDVSAIIDGPVNITILEDLRRTRQQIWYDRVNVTANLTEGKNFRRLRIHIDADAESANDYGEARPEAIYSRWLTAANDGAVATGASRRVGYYRDSPKNIGFKVDAKDRAIREGDVVDVQTSGLTDVTGAPELSRCLVLKRKDEGGQISLLVRVLNFGARYAFIAPDAAGTYPADSEWVHIAPDSEFFDDGTPGYQAF